MKNLQQRDRRRGVQRLAIAYVFALLLAGCSGSSSNSGDPVMTEPKHTHYHVHSDEVKHDHQHDDFDAAAHEHRHDHQEDEHKENDDRGQP